MGTNADAIVIAPHPDDPEFGAAGTIARWTSEGKKVVYVLCTSGEKGTSDRNLKPEDLAVIREKEQMAAAKVVGVADVCFMRLPDQELEDTPEFRKQIVKLIRIYRPDTIVTCDPYRRYFNHRDHRITGQAVLDAAYPYARDHLSYHDLLEENLEPHKVREILLWHTEDVNYRSDISETFSLKIEAIRCHKSQIAGFGITDIEKELEEQCQKMASGETYKFAESFHSHLFQR
jgi:LmbE family N-acetylglucosaminyl deacetylase